MLATDARLNRVLAFAQVVDAKSPWTTGIPPRGAIRSRHQLNANSVKGRARPACNVAARPRRLGISNRILDKPGPSATDDEHARMRLHQCTHNVFSNVWPAFVISG